MNTGPEGTHHTSSAKVHYRLRPAKNIQRKMLCEAIHRLHAFSPIDSYRYIGFGSWYFGDFILFHRVLGITEMISIEWDVVNRLRYEFNRPFGCIKLEFGASGDVLPKLELEGKKTILWLDYDSPLDRTMLEDISCFCDSAPSGSVLVVTVDAAPVRSNGRPSSLPESRYEELVGRVGEKKVPPDVKGKDLQEWGYAKVHGRIVTNEISQTLVTRNGGLDAKDKLQYRQLFNFQYADGAKMGTVGGVLFREGDKPGIERCAFDDLDFVRSDEMPYRIEVPKLTYRELRFLNSHLPSEHNGGPPESPIPEREFGYYARVYRYFPAFAEADIV